MCALNCQWLLAFLQEVGTVDMIFALRHLIGKHGEFNNRLYVAFLDLENRLTGYKEDSTSINISSDYGNATIIITFILLCFSLKLN